MSGTTAARLRLDYIPARGRGKKATGHGALHPHGRIQKSKVPCRWNWGGVRQMKDRDV